MKKRFLQYLLVFVLMASVLPISASADSFDDGWELGFEEGYSVGWADAECAMEYGDNGYATNKTYAPDKLDEWYDEGYDEGYRIGYNRGHEDGIEEAQKQANESSGSWLVFAVSAALLYGAYKIGVYVGEERSSKTIGRLHEENMRYARLLRKEDEF